MVSLTDSPSMVSVWEYCSKPIVGYWVLSNSWFTYIFIMEVFPTEDSPMTETFSPVSRAEEVL